MEIRIAIVETDPPSGHVCVDQDGTQRDFSGWLGLLSVLYDMLPSPAVPD